MSMSPILSSIESCTPGCGGGMIGQNKAGRVTVLGAWVLRTCTLETSSASSTPRRCLMSCTPPKVLSPMRAPRARLAWESMKPDAGVMPAPQALFFALVDESQQRSKATLFEVDKSVGQQVSPEAFAELLALSTVSKQHLQVKASGPPHGREQQRSEPSREQALEPYLRGRRWCR